MQNIKQWSDYIAEEDWEIDLSQCKGVKKGSQIWVYFKLMK